MLSTMRSSNSIRPSYVGGDGPAALEEQAVGQLHDVRLVDGRDLAPAVGDGVVEGEAGDPLRRGAGDDLDALRGVGADHVLDAGVQVLGVLADDDEVDVLVARLEALDRARRAGGWRTGRAPGGASTLTLRKPSPTGVVIGPLSATLLRWIDSRTCSGQRRAVLGHDGLAGVDDLPFERDAGRVEDAAGRLRQLRTDAVAGDQGDTVGHGPIVAAARAPTRGVPVRRRGRARRGTISAPATRSRTAGDLARA